MNTVNLEAQSIMDKLAGETSPPEGYGLQMVPAPEEEGGYRVEIGSQGIDPVDGLTSEQYANFDGCPIEYFSPLSDHLDILFTLTASLCLIVLRRGRFSGGLPAAVFFFLFHDRFWSLMADPLLPLWLPLLNVSVLFGLLCLFYRGSIGKKLYLSVTFQALFELCLAIANYGQRFIEEVFNTFWQFIPDDQFPLHSNVSFEDYRAGPVVNTLYFDWQGCLLLAIICGLLLFSTLKMTRGVRRDAEELPSRELLFLLMPALTGLVFVTFTGVAQTLLSNPLFIQWATWGDTVNGLILYFLIPFLAFTLLLCILYASDIYRKLIAFVEEQNRTALLTNQMDQMQGHVREIEQLYTGIRSMRHDMHNYLFDIKSLLAAQGIDVEGTDSELSVYFSGIGTALDALNFSFHTGNPVTDVVLNGKYQQAKRLGIRFSSAFLFPSDYGLDVFDVSIILNNALENALEACEALLKQDPEAQPFINIASYCQNNMLLIELDNSFDGAVSAASSGLLPATSKKDAEHHGLGMQNILRCAEKYYGSARYTATGQTFSLTVMLQRVQEPAQV